MDERERAADGEIHSADYSVPGKGATGNSASRILCAVAYLVLLLAVVCVAAFALRLRWDPAWVGPLFLIGVIAYLALLERLIPYDRNWHPGKAEWRWYGIYFLLTMAGSGLAQLLVALAVGLISPEEPAHHLWAEIPGAPLTGSLVSYAVHRPGHRNAPPLRQFHLAPRPRTHRRRPPGSRLLPRDRRDPRRPPAPLATQTRTAPRPGVTGTAAPCFTTTHRTTT